MPCLQTCKCNLNCATWPHALTSSSFMSLGVTLPFMATALIITQLWRSRSFLSCFFLSCSACLIWCIAVLTDVPCETRERGGQHTRVDMYCKAYRASPPALRQTVLFAGLTAFAFGLIQLIWTICLWCSSRRAARVSNREEQGETSSLPAYEPVDSRGLVQIELK